MKLKNKKTGVIGVLEATTYQGGRPDNTVEVYEVGMGAVRVLARYNTLKELNADWEDYKPAEPLIKDEKVRKAIRAWAVACDVKLCHYDGDGDFATRWYGIKLSRSQIKLDDGTYTIAELCGEEEE